MSNITYRWIDGPLATQAEWNTIDEKLASRGWMSLNKNTSRVLVAEDEGEIIAFFCLQLVPHVEPLFVSRKYRDTLVAGELANQMQEFLDNHHARGYMAVAENPQVEEMMRVRGMEKIQYPVYVKVV